MERTDYSSGSPVVSPMPSAFNLLCSAEWDFLICRYSPPGNVVGQRVP